MSSHASRRTIAIAALSLAVLVLPACTDGSSSSSAPTSPTPAQTSPATTSPATDPASDRAAAETAYRAIWPLLAKFDQRYPEAEWTAVLSRVAVDPQLSQAIAVARQQRRTGVRLYGEPRPRAPRVTLNGATRASVADCADFSRYGQADAKTGKPRTVGVARSPVKATLIEGRDGVWRVAEITYPGGTC